MTDHPWKILLIGREPQAGARLVSAFRSGNPGFSAAVQAIEPEEAGNRIPGETPDLLFVDLDSLGEDGIAVLASAHRHAPGVPLIAISHDGGETRAIEALQAGAQDCLSAADAEGLPLLRAVRYAIERNRFQCLEDEVVHQVSRERELGGLNVMSSHAPVPITERSLGTIPLMQRASQEFDELVRRYGELLDRSLLGRSNREMARLMEELNDISDRLGMLGAGPRDAVELHKAAMTARLDVGSARKNKGYVEEGRLLLVQLMGHLVSFYRSLSWGRSPTLRLGTVNHNETLLPPGTAGKKSK